MRQPNGVEEPAPSLPRGPIDTNIPPAEHRTFRFYVTDSTEKFKRLAARFLGRQVDNVEHVDFGGMSRPINVTWSL